MSDLVVTASVTRDTAHGGPTDLSLQSTAYTVISADPGAKSWQRETATSNWTHGRTLIAATLDIETVDLGIRCKGSTMSQLDSNLAAVCRAFEQFSYALTLTIDGVTWTWACEAADYEVQFSKFHMMARVHEVTFHVPRNPIPTAGSV